MESENTVLAIEPFNVYLLRNRGMKKRIDSRNMRKGQRVNWWVDKSCTCVGLTLVLVAVLFAYECEAITYQADVKGEEQIAHEVGLDNKDIVTAVKGVLRSVLTAQDGIPRTGEFTYVWKLGDEYVLEITGQRKQTHGSCREVFDNVLSKNYLIWEQIFYATVEDEFCRFNYEFVKVSDWRRYSEKWSHVVGSWRLKFELASQPKIELLPNTVLVLERKRK